MSTDSADADRWHLALERRGPSILVLDRDGNVVMSSTGDRVPPQEIASLAAAVHSIENPTEGEPLFFASGWIARVKALDGEFGRFLAVLAEPFRARDHLEAGSRRYHLTRREHEVLRGLLAGENTAQIGEALGIATSTVSLHVKALLTKTSSHSRAEMLGRIVAHSTER